MRSRSLLLAALLVGTLTLAAGATPQSRQDKILAEFEARTGLVKVEPPGADGEYLGKEHRGYKVLFTGKAGNVWGRYAARLTMGEIGRELGGIWAWLTGSYEYGPGVAGSSLDRLLAELIGQPLSIMVILEHGHSTAPRLDIVSGSSTIKPEVELPRRQRISRGAGHVYTADDAIALRIEGNADLVERLKRYRGEYIRLDEHAVTFLWSGQETDYSAMIRDHPDYWAMIVSIMDSLADIADAVPAGR